MGTERSEYSHNFYDNKKSIYIVYIKMAEKCNYTGTDVFWALVIGLLVGIGLGIGGTLFVQSMNPDSFVPISYDVIKTLDPTDPKSLREASLQFAKMGSKAGDTINYTGDGVGRVNYPAFPIFSGNLPSTRFEDIDNTRNVLFGRPNY